MLIDNLKNADLYYGLSERIKKALMYLKNTDLLNLENGKYEIEGGDIYVIVQDYQTKPQFEGKWEAHKKYIDIQYIIKGREKIGWGTISDFSEITEYNENNDIFFLEGNGDFFEIREGFFTILTPQDVHMPSISVGEGKEYTKKAVIKIRV